MANLDDKPKKLGYAFAELEVGGVKLSVTAHAPGATEIKLTFETHGQPFKCHSFGTDDPRAKSDHADWCNSVQPIHEDGDCNCWFTARFATK